MPGGHRNIRHINPSHPSTSNQTFDRSSVVVILLILQPQIKLLIVRLWYYVVVVCVSRLDPGQVSFREA